MHLTVKLFHQSISQHLCIRVPFQLSMSTSHIARNLEAAEKESPNYVLARIQFDFFVKIAFNVSSIEKAPFTIRGAASNGIQFESVLFN